MAHAQFETIHPFLDGPILYLSLFLKQRRPEYYDLLDGVRLRGDWESWLEFFLTGIRDTAEQAISSARRILTVFERDRRKIEELGRPAATVLRVYEHAQSPAGNAAGTSSTRRTSRS
jgi:Fic family protein